MNNTTQNSSGKNGHHAYSIYGIDSVTVSHRFSIVRFIVYSLAVYGLYSLLA